MEPSVIDDFPDSSRSEVRRIEKSVPSSSSDASPPGKSAYFCVCNVDEYEWFAFDISDDIKHNQPPPPLKYIKYPIPFHEDDEDGAVNIKPKTTANMDWLLGWGIMGLKTLYAIDDWNGDWKGPSVWKEGNRVERINLRSPGAKWERLPQIPNQIAASAHTFVLDSKFYCLGGFPSKNGLESQYMDYDLSVNEWNSLPPPPCLNVDKILSTAKEVPKPCLPSQNMESEANNVNEMLSVHDGFKPYFYECGQWEMEQWERVQWERWHRRQRDRWEAKGKGKGKGKVEMFREWMEILMKKWQKVKLFGVREMNILVEWRRQILEEIEIQMEMVEMEMQMEMKLERERESVRERLREIEFQIETEMRLERTREPWEQRQKQFVNHVLWGNEVEVGVEMEMEMEMEMMLKREREQERGRMLVQVLEGKGVGVEVEVEVERELGRMWERKLAREMDRFVGWRRQIKRKWEQTLKSMWEIESDILDEPVIHSQNIMELKRQSPWAMAYNQSRHMWESLPDPPHRPVKVDSIFSAAAEVPSSYIVVGLPENGLIQIYYVNIKMWKTYKFEICPNFSPNVLSGPTLVVGNKLFWYSVDDRCIVVYNFMKKMWFLGQLPIHDHGEHFGEQDVDTPPCLAHLGYDKFCLLWVSVLPPRRMLESKNDRISRLHCMKLRVTFGSPDPESGIFHLKVLIMSCQSYLASGSKFFRGGLVV